MERGEALKKIDLFPVAVFIMGIVSCYTTATGIYPMLNNWILSYAPAIALSVFMVAIALRIPQAYREGNQVKLIMGYIFVASFSVLLNFNAIYGMHVGAAAKAETTGRTHRSLGHVGHVIGDMDCVARPDHEKIDANGKGEKTGENMH